MIALILVAMERKRPYLYTGSKFRVMTFSIDNPEGGCNNPFWKICLEKTTPRRTRGLIINVN